MISTASKKVVGWLLRSGAISANQKDLYEYAVYSLLFTMFPLGLVSIVSIVMGMFVQGVLFIAPFILLRKFSGGFHLNSSTVCLISSVSIIAISLWFIRNYCEADSTILLSVMVLLSGLCISLLSPIDNEARTLTAKEKNAFRKIAVALTVICMLTYFILAINNLLFFSIPIGTGVVLTALLQIPCIFFSHKNDRVCND